MEGFEDDQATFRQPSLLGRTSPSFVVSKDGFHSQFLGSKAHFKNRYFSVNVNNNGYVAWVNSANQSVGVWGIYRVAYRTYLASYEAACNGKRIYGIYRGFVQVLGTGPSVGLKHFRQGRDGVLQCGDREVISTMSKYAQFVIQHLNLVKDGNLRNVFAGQGGSPFKGFHYSQVVAACALEALPSLGLGSNVSNADGKRHFNVAARSSVFCAGVASKVVKDDLLTAKDHDGRRRGRMCVNFRVCLSWVDSASSVGDSFPQGITSTILSMMLRFPVGPLESSASGNSLMPSLGEAGGLLKADFVLSGSSRWLVVGLLC